MPRKKILPAVPAGENLELVNIVARRDHVSRDQLWRWKKRYGLVPRHIKSPGRTGHQLTCTTWFRTFLFEVDAHSRKQLLKRERNRAACRARQRR
jgi:hypothetical protein